jgi:methyl-accepting chemotaxis protein
MNEAEEYQKKAAAFREKIMLSLKNSQVDDWVADRMLYVVDYLDVLLQGFFAFQDTLWDRYGITGEKLSLDFSQRLENRLNFLVKEHQQHLLAWQGLIDKMPESIKENVSKLPDAINTKLLSTGLEQALNQVTKSFLEDEKLRAEAAARLSKLYAALLGSAKPDLKKTLTESFQVKLDEQLAASQKEWQGQLQQVLQKAVEGVQTDALMGQLAQALQKDSLQTLNASLQAHLQAHPLTKTLNQNINAQSQTLFQIREITSSSFDQLKESIARQQESIDALAKQMSEQAEKIDEIHEGITQLQNLLGNLA